MFAFYSIVAIAVAAVPGASFAQETTVVLSSTMFPAGASKKVKPVTVCEALADRKAFNGKPVAIVGRIDCGSSLIDHVCFLAEDRCEQPVTTDGYTWPNKVVIVDSWEEGMPKPPSATPEINRDTLVRKLSLVRQSTALGVHKEPRFKTEGRTITFSHFADVNDEWGVAYGLIFIVPRPGKDKCGTEIECGGFGGAPAALITAPGSLRTVKDDEHAGPK